MALGNVAVLIYDGVNPFEFGVACEAFGLDRSYDGVPVPDFAVCAPTPGPVRTSLGFDLGVEHGLDRIDSADLVAVPAMGRGTEVPAGVAEALHGAVDRGARIMTLCSGAFTLGEIGLLDGRECTTHWMYTDELAARFPRTRVLPEVLYVDDGPIVTSAGTAAGLDAALHIWRKEHGAAIANTIARRMVVPPQREGGQAQFIRRPVPATESDSFGQVLDWAARNLEQNLDVETMAARAAMSTRTFARRFRAETGVTPHAWVTHQRVLAAEELLERSDQNVEQIASRVGFGTAAVLRQHFTRFRGLSPQAYRRRFACPD